MSEHIKMPLQLKEIGTDVRKHRDIRYKRNRNKYTVMEFSR